MNHLRELLELHPSAWLVADDFSDNDAYALAGDLHRAATSAMCFWMGDVDELDGLKAVKELSRLPFDSCWFEILCVTADKQWIVGCLAVNHFSGTRMIGFTRTAGTWMLRWTADADSFNGGELRVLPATEHAGKEALAVRYKIAAFLTAMNCKNVRRARVDPDEKLQKARGKRGKQPLFSYWTLELNGRQEGGEDRGGTHTSPRLHLRRGHPREYAPGQWTWVTATIVGNKAAGMVHKDYSAGAALAVAAQ